MMRGMFELAAKRGCPIVLMHMQGTPKTMQISPSYGDVLNDVKGFLGERIATAKQAGIAEEKILIDPGIGFLAKRWTMIYSCCAGYRKIAEMGRPMVVGVSRKEIYRKDYRRDGAERPYIWNSSGSGVECH